MQEELNDNLEQPENLQDDDGQQPANSAPLTNENVYIGAPETYDYTTIKMPDGYNIDTELTEKFNPIAKELNLSQQGVNKLCDFFVQYQQGLTANADEKLAEFKNIEKAKTKASYEQMLNSDVEIGGGNKDKMNAYIDAANIGYKEFASEKLQEVLAENSLNFHPEVIKLFHRLGKLCGTDKIENSNNPVVPKTDPATVLYGED